LPRKTEKDSAGSFAVDSAVRDRVYVEADGELLGCLPARMTIVPDALSLLVPATT
jgi:diacylglycerol kinase family enzyme